MVSARMTRPRSAALDKLQGRLPGRTRCVSDSGVKCPGAARQRPRARLACELALQRAAAAVVVGRGRAAKVLERAAHAVALARGGGARAGRGALEVDPRLGALRVPRRQLLMRQGRVRLGRHISRERPVVQRALGGAHQGMPARHGARSARRARALAAMDCRRRGLASSSSASGGSTVIERRRADSERRLGMATLAGTRSAGSASASGGGVSGLFWGVLGC